MAAQFNGKWEVIKSENSNQFFKDLGAFPEEVLKKWPDLDDISNKFVDEVNVTEDAIEVVEYFKGNLAETYKYHFNKDEKETRNGMNSMVRTTFDGNKITMVDNGPNYVATHVREVNGNHMTLTMTNNKTACKGIRTYKKI